MSDDLLRQSLLSADATAPQNLPHIMAADLLNAAQQRRARATTGRVAMALIVIAAAFVLASRSSHDPQIADSHSHRTIDEIKAELAWLQREASVQEQVIGGLSAELLASREAEQRSAAAMIPDELLQEASRSAAISWQYATMVEQETTDLDHAKREYQRVGQRFPGTTWATLANSSLERLSNPDGARPSL